MNLKLKGFSQLVEDMCAALQGSATTLVDVSVGSVVRAIFEANASVVLWLQWLVLQVLQTTRASTSRGLDLDSWMLDFGITRLPAAPAGGTVTFSRFASNFVASIPVGSLVKTTDGSVSFSVVGDPSISIWEATSRSYILPNGVSSADIPVIANAVGAVGNVLSGTISVVASSLAGVDNVTNASAFANGIDSETDQAFRSRFQSFLASRSRATLTAIRDAISNVRQGLTAIILENTASNGESVLGSFVVIIDDGTGYPSVDLLANVATAVDFVRPIGSVFSVIPPKVMSIDVSLYVTISAAGDVSGCIASIENQVKLYLNGLSIGKCASVTRVGQHAYLAGEDIENISDVILNGSTVDITPPSFTVIKAGDVSVMTNGG